MLVISFIIISTIKRESILLFPIITVTSIHPIFSVPIGMFATSLGSLCRKKIPLPKSVQGKDIIGRFFTYSINLHLTMMAIIMYYLYQVWLNLGLPSAWNFNNKAFDQCLCIERNEGCLNYDRDFQTAIMKKFPFSIPIPILLVAIIITSFLCHFVHSIMTALPPPLTLYEYILGMSSNQSKPHSEEIHELDNVEDQIKVNNQEIYSCLFMKKLVTH